MKTSRAVMRLVPAEYRATGTRQGDHDPIRELTVIERRADRVAVRASTTRVGGTPVLDMLLHDPAGVALNRRRNSSSALVRNAGTPRSVVVLDEPVEDRGWRVSEFCLRLPPAPLDSERSRAAYVASYRGVLELVRDVGPPADSVVYFNHFWFPTSVRGLPASGRETPVVFGSMSTMSPTSSPHIVSAGVDVHPMDLFDFVAELLDAYTHRISNGGWIS